MSPVNLIEQCEQNRFDKTNKKIIDFCDCPRTVEEIMKHINLRQSSTKRRLLALADTGYINVIKPSDNSTRGWKYRSTNKQNPVSVYKPQGICVFGVWL